MVKTMCVKAAKRLCNKALQLHKEHAGALLKTTRAVQNLKIKGRDDFGEGCHTTVSEPYYYDSASHPVKRPSAIPIRKNGMCVVANEISNYTHDDGVGTVSVPQSLEVQLLITHAQTISELEKEIVDDPVHPCCSCERLQQRKCVT